MFRAIFLSSVLIASVAVGNDIQNAEACGVKMGARKAPKIQRSKSSKNPSRILIVGSKDSELIKKLRGARHQTEYASNVSNAKRDRYDLVIADESQLAEARSRFAGSQILKKKSSTRSTSSTAETMLARTAVKSNNRKTGIVAIKENRKPVEVGTEGVDARKATTSGEEGPLATATPETKVSSDTTESKPPVRVAVADTDTQPDSTRKPKAEPKTVVEPKQPKPRKPRVADTDATPTPKAKNLKWTRTLTFGTNKTNLGPAQMRRLKANALWLQENPGSSLTIEGHTDSVGDEAYNMDLSERRANVARDFMTSFGISADRITVEAKGEQDPAFEPSTSGRNRRIVLIKD